MAIFGLQGCVDESREREGRLREKVAQLESGLHEVQSRLTVVEQERDETTAKLKVMMGTC